MQSGFRLSAETAIAMRCCAMVAVHTNAQTSDDATPAAALGEASKAISFATMH